MFVCSIAIVSSFRQIPKPTLEKLAEEPHLTKRLVIAVAVIHALLMSRQQFGSVGLTYWHPFGANQLLNAVEMVSTNMLCSEGKMRPSLEDLCYFVPNVSSED